MKVYGDAAASLAGRVGRVRGVSPFVSLAIRTTKWSWLPWSAPPRARSNGERTMRYVEISGFFNLGNFAADANHRHSPEGVSSGLLRRCRGN
jgi:hypothetical protein